MSLMFRSLRAWRAAPSRDDATAAPGRWSGRHDSGAQSDDEVVAAPAKVLRLLPETRPRIS